jgi:hypothetical protein
VSSHQSSGPYQVVKPDERGVAGFFEDLPVLMFVLAGTFTIVVSAWNASQVVISREEDKALELLTDRCAELLLSELVGEHPWTVVTVASVCSTRLTQIVAEFLEGREFCMSIVMVHPELKWILQAPGRSGEAPERACSASRLINALTDGGYTAILAVRIVVW